MLSTGLADLEKFALIDPKTLFTMLGIPLRMLNPEIAVIEACHELDVTFVPFSPVGRGYLADKLLDPDGFDKDDLRHTFCR